jgi:hypothetical protein
MAEDVGDGVGKKVPRSIWQKRVDISIDVEVPRRSFRVGHGKSP